MAKPTKYIYLKVIQGHYGQGWEDVDAHDKSVRGWVKDWRTNVKAYRENEPGVAHRSIDRRELREPGANAA